MKPDLRDQKLFNTIGIVIRNFCNKQGMEMLKYVVNIDQNSD